ncbi:MAG: ABC transporter ATP-binding protein [Lachnospiraceae bacterium]|nr:ABC transporter ATP-binding protein [Lachnospiraceae bacterium]MBR6468951.1 ABC transporter ATP-binding protein [Lachnospiraceae bacterium]
MKIELKHISKDYGRKNVLSDVSAEAESGSCVGILGGNGCGKSTLLSVLAGIRKPTSGSFICDGHDIFGDRRLMSRIIGYVPQGTPLIEELSARDNLRIFYDNDGLKRELEQGTLKLLGIDEYINVPVRKMSGGMKKRLSIGCAVANHPPVLILDEPSAALDLICKQSINGYLAAYKRNGGIILLATHDEEELKLCDKWYILKNGISVPYEYDGNVDKLIRNF